ncbi:hypothetical protein [Nocardia sp. NPDC049526]|uniref:hypothetical protein n=1 Tax=Nocardia sp. NPDC049526 TaxID=3364316 RepID=UPI0037A7C3EF
MSEKVVKEKVLVYVVRDGKLLVFRHTDYSWEEVGIQVPARRKHIPLRHRTSCAAVDLSTSS